MDTRSVQNKIYGVPKGFRVHWEIKRGDMLAATYWPERTESLIPFEEMAWAAAREIAAKTVGDWVNFYVVDEHSVPVDGYATRIIRNREAVSEDRPPHSAPSATWADSWAVGAPVGRADQLIALHVGGSYTLLSVTEVGALVTMLTDAQERNRG